MNITKPDISVNLCGVHLKAPVMTASGTFGYGEEFDRFMDIERLGAIIVKGLSLNPSRGNPPPRIVETPCGMLNAIGLENVGIEHFIDRKLPYLKQIDVPIFVNIYGNTIEEYSLIASRLDGCDGISGLEVNISCPNVKAGGIAFGVDPEIASKVVAAVKKKTKLPVMVKLTPNVTDIVLMAKTIEDSGADAVSLINTLTGMAVDIHTRRPGLANITGGLSGPAIKPIALRMVWQVAQAVNIPVVGIGGIMTGEDALEFFIVGADAVQIGTANFVNPNATVEIIDAVGAYMVENSISKIEDIVGSLVIE